jgi:hypothetical protein
MRRCLIVFAVGCNFSAGQVHDAPAGSEPAPPIDANIVFVTSNTVIVGMLGGLDAADAFCQMSAQAAQLPGRYVAWLSTTRTNAATRLANARGWVRLDGKPVVDTVDDLVAGHILYPPLLDEHGVSDPSAAFEVATATAGSGMRMGETCNDYTAEAGAITIGRADGTTERWTNVNAGVGCSSAVHLYCFGVDRANRVAVTPAPGSRAFVSNEALTLASIQGADQQCASEAMSAALPGVFVAGLATTTESVSSHVGVGPWVRVDGVAIGKLDALLAPLNVTAQGQYVSTQVWTGATGPNQMGTPASTCADWASSSGSGLIGDTARSSGFAFGDGSVPCTTLLPVYCLESKQ